VLLSGNSAHDGRVGLSLDGTGRRLGHSDYLGRIYNVEQFACTLPVNDCTEGSLGTEELDAYGFSEVACRARTALDYGGGCMVTAHCIDGYANGHEVRSE
jgi:hypothetical protein